MFNDEQYRCVLTIAGSDSSGGAGIQADIKSISATGCYAASVITALTAQNTQTVISVNEVPAEIVSKQLEAVFDDINFDAIKIGMLPNCEIIDVVINKLTACQPKNVVFDPVMISKGGDRLMTEDAIIFLKDKLLPIVNLITPNRKEAELLANFTIQSRDDMQQAAHCLAQKYKTNILIKESHLDETISMDILFLQKENKHYWFETKTVDTLNTHGTGCTLSSAIASFLAQGNDMIQAIRNAKNYVTKAISDGSHFKLGKGRGPVHHFSHFWNKQYATSTLETA
jgi:hydroxymethylpyrimidine/phosphomethylpyrimidine kinase